MTAETTRQLPINDIIEWDVLNWSQLLHYWQPILSELPRNSKILAVGERNGGLSLWLALLGFDVVCTDMKPVTEKAIALHKKYNVAHKIEYRQLDILDTGYDREQYDIVMAKSVIGGLKANKHKSRTRNFEVQKRAVDNIYTMLKPGGFFLSAENLKGGKFTRYARKIRKKDKGWRHLGYNELSELYKSFPIVQIKTFGILPTFFSQKVSNYCMYFINRYILFFIPQHSRYISFVVAQK